VKGKRGFKIDNYVIIEKAFNYPEEHKTSKETLTRSSTAKTTKKQKMNVKEFQKNSKNPLKKAKINNKIQESTKQPMDTSKQKYYMASNPLYFYIKS